MKARQHITIRRTGDAEGTGVAFGAVTNLDFQQGALIVTYDGEDGPEQVIFAPSAWLSATTRMEPGPRG